MRASVFGVAVGCIGLLVGSACSSFEASDTSTPEAGAGDDAGADGPGVTGTPSFGITVAVGDPTATSYVTQGGADATLKVTLTRQPASTGAVDVTVTGLPDGVTAQPLTIQAGELTGTLTLSAGSTSVPGTTAKPMVKAHEQSHDTSALTSFTSFVRGKSGTLDTTFGTGGIVYLSDLIVGGGVSNMQVLADGSIVAAIRVGTADAVTHLTAAGAIDKTFGGSGSGIATFEFTATTQITISAVEGASAGVYAVEYIPPSTNTLYRLHLDGTRDTGFAGVGYVVVDSTDKAASKVLALPDGSALVSRGTTVATSHWKTDGTLDSAYGTSGSCPANGQMLRRASGEVLFLGSELRGCTPTGGLDPAVGFGGGGAEMAFTENEALLLLDGSAYVLLPPPTYSTEDSSIGQDGNVELQGGGAAILGIPGGGVLVAGGTSIVAHNADGTINTNFGTAGTATFQVKDNNDSGVQWISAAPDGRFVVGSGDGIDNSAVYARFWE